MGALHARLRGGGGMIRTVAAILLAIIVLTTLAGTVLILRDARPMAEEVTRVMDCAFGDQKFGKPSSPRAQLCGERHD